MSPPGDEQLRQGLNKSVCVRACVCVSARVTFRGVWGGGNSCVDMNKCGDPLNARHLDLSFHLTRRHLTGPDTELQHSLRMYQRFQC